MAITYADFNKVDVRVGKIIDVEDFPETKKPAFKLTIDMGPLGIKRTSAQVAHYKKEDLLDRLVLCVVNFPPKQIGHFMSEVLTLGVPDEHGKWALVQPDRNVPLGGRLA